MCYTVLLSTTSDEDLSARNTHRLRFSTERLDVAAAQTLKFPHQWHVGSASVCSCSFRHLHDAELGFGEPVEWFREEPEHIAATLEFIDVVRRLAENGDSVDCIDVWAGDPPRPLVARDVDLRSVDDRAFRFFENVHFTFVSAGK